MTVHQYNTYESHEPQPEETPQAPIRINADAGRTTSLTVRNGLAEETETSKGQRVRSSEINPHFGDGSVFATARNPRGYAVHEVTSDTLITVNGVQGPVSFFEAQGIVHRGADGRYAEGSGKPQGVPTEIPEASPEASPDHLTMTTEAAQAVDNALDVVADHQLDPLAGLGIGVATGDLDVSVLESRFSSYSGVSPEEAASRVAVMTNAYQRQADDAITSRCGVEAADLAAFYEWAKGSQKGALREAVQKQIHSNDLSGYRALASRYLAANPPTVEAVKAEGYAVRQEGPQPEVFMDSQWISIASAARLGYL